MTAFGKSATGALGDQGHTAAATVIARESHFVGEISGSRAVRVEGSLQGKIDLKAALEIVEGATVEAEVRAASVRIGGAVTGNVSATGVVELLASARVRGDISAPALHVVEGAKLEGRVIMRIEPSGGAQPAPGERLPAV